MQLSTSIRYFLIITLATLPLISKAEDVSEATRNIIVTPFTGYRYDIFKWATPNGTSSTDPILSELTWKNNISETGIKIGTKPAENQFNFLGQFKYGRILGSSKNQDSDWDNIGEFSRTFSSVKGNIFDLSGSVGFSKAWKNTLINYAIGIDYTKYQMRDYGLYYSINRVQDEYISDPLGRTHPKSQLVKKYNFDNYAPWVGASMDYSVSDKLSIVPTIKLYLFYLYGKGYWVLRDDFQQNPSFTGKALGIGASFDTALLYKYTNNLDFKVNIGIKKFDMKQGRQKTFLANGTDVTTDLKKLSLFSSSVSVGIKYQF